MQNLESSSFWLQAPYNPMDYRSTGKFTDTESIRMNLTEDH